jgi:AcrR family transcriptional regulator
VTTDADPEPAADGGPVSWREMAVARSLGSARTRAENRVQRFLDAALELMNDNATGKEFTVQEVVERSGQSLRSFYQYFGGKHELLLALFEESVRSTTEFLSQKMAAEPDAAGRLHCFVVEYYRLCRPATKATVTKSTAKAAAKPRPTPAMVEFAQQLLTGHPTEAAAAFAPLVTLFGDVLDEAAVEGAVRPGLRHSPIAGVVLEAIMFNAFSWTIGGVSSRPDGGDPAEELWDLILHGIGAQVS